MERERTREKERERKCEAVVVVNLATGNRSSIQALFWCIDSIMVRGPQEEESSLLSAVWESEREFRGKKKNHSQLVCLEFAMHSFRAVNLKKNARPEPRNLPEFHAVSMTNRVV